MRRLKHHASILVWAGSNENEKALRQDWFHVRGILSKLFNIGKDYNRYYHDFYKLYVRTIKPIGEYLVLEVKGPVKFSAVLRLLGVMADFLYGDRGIGANQFRITYTETS